MGGVNELDKAQPVGNTKEGANDISASPGVGANDNRDKGVESVQQDAGEAVDGTFHPDTEDRLATIASTKAAGGTSVGNTYKERPLSKQSSSVTGIFASLAIIVSLLAVGGVAYIWYEIRLKQADIASEKVSLERDIESQQSQINRLLTDIEALQTQLESAQSETSDVKARGAELSDRMATVEGQVAELTGAQRIDWMLKEVEHFVMVAERRLSLLGDVDGATALMFEADQLVLRMAEPAARPLRAAIKADLYALEQAGSASIDSEGLFAQLSLLKKQMATLEPAAVQYEPVSTVPVQSPPPGLFGFEYLWFEIKSFFKSLVRVQRVADGEVKPLLMPDQRAYFEQNMLLLFEQAQLALLRSDQQVYTASLIDIGERVELYLRTNTSAAQAFLKSVSSLADKNIAPSIPSIEKSVRAVQVFRDYWQEEKVERQIGREAINAEVNAEE